jgi:hypothetical protein
MTAPFASNEWFVLLQREIQRVVDEKGDQNQSFTFVEIWVDAPTEVRKSPEFEGGFRASVEGGVVTVSRAVTTMDEGDVKIVLPWAAVNKSVRMDAATSSSYVADLIATGDASLAGDLVLAPFDAGLLHDRILEVTAP